MKRQRSSRLPHYYLIPDKDERHTVGKMITRHKIKRQTAASILRPEFECVNPLMAFRMLTRWYIVKYAREGKTSEQMAAIFKVSVRTFRNWVNEIFKGDFE